MPRTGLIPRTGYLVAGALTVFSAFAAIALAFSGGAEATHVEGEEPYFTCRASVASATLLDNNTPIPTIEPLAANSNREECAEDESGAPTIALPPPPDTTPAVSATVVRATTDIYCADDDPNAVGDTADDDECDAGRRSFEQQVVSRATAENARIALGGAEGVPAGLEIRARVANTSARARCGPGNVPVLSSTSEVLGLEVLIAGQPPLSIIIPPNSTEETEIDLGIAKLTLNEIEVTSAPGEPVPAPNAAGEYVFTDAATEGQITRRAIHLEVPGGDNEATGDIADVVVAESIADFHGDVCPEGRVVIRKETVPDGDTTPFGFTTTGGLNPTPFTLQDGQERVFPEVQPNQPNQPYTVTENAPPTGYVLTGINCVENYTGNTTTTPGERRANINVSPGETVTCTFINAKLPTCPDGSQPVNGTCPTAVTCPGGITPVNGTCPGTLTCPGGIAPTNGVCLGTITCPGGVTPVNGACPGTTPPVVCPVGRLVNGQCVVLDIQCPAGTTFNPVTRGCSEAPRGGTLVPLNIPALQNLFRASPCIGQGFGALVGIIGTNGPDRITGTNTSDRIFALAGNDRVSGGRGDDCVEGGSGRDVIDGSNGNDVMLGASEGDQIVGGPGRDRMDGGSGRDNLSGANGNDTVRGGGGRDRMNGGFGNDRLFGGAGNDGIHTGNGRDRVNAGSGNDVINAATVGPPAFVDCGPGSKDRVRINRNETRRTRNCEFVDVPRRIRSNNRQQAPR